MLLNLIVDKVLVDELTRKIAPIMILEYDILCDKLAFSSCQLVN